MKSTYKTIWILSAISILFYMLGYFWYFKYYWICLELVKAFSVKEFEFIGKMPYFFGDSNFMSLTALLPPLFWLISKIKKNVTFNYYLINAAWFISFFTLITIILCRIDSHNLIIYSNFQGIIVKKPILAAPIGQIDITKNYAIAVVLSLGIMATYNLITLKVNTFKKNNL